MCRRLRREKSHVRERRGEALVWAPHAHVTVVTTKCVVGVIGEVVSTMDSSQTKQLVLDFAL